MHKDGYVLLAKNFSKMFVAYPATKTTGGIEEFQFPTSRFYVERRDKPACCRGCKSPTGKEQRIHPGLESCAWHREVSVEAEAEVSGGRAIELRKTAVSGCRPSDVTGKATRLVALDASGQPVLRSRRTHAR